jgi:hypothetical protein
MYVTPQPIRLFPSPPCSILLWRLGTNAFPLGEDVGWQEGWSSIGRGARSCSPLPPSIPPSKPVFSLVHILSICWTQRRQVRGLNEREYQPGWVWGLWWGQLLDEQASHRIGAGGTPHPSTSFTRVVTGMSGCVAVGSGKCRELQHVNGWSLLCCCWRVGRPQARRGGGVPTALAAPP